MLFRTGEAGPAQRLQGNSAAGVGGCGVGTGEAEVPVQGAAGGLEGVLEEGQGNHQQDQVLISITLSSTLRINYQLPD